MNPLNPIFTAYEEGFSAQMLSGRPLHDLVCDDDGAIRPLVESLRRALRQRFGMALITYSLAGGLDWNEAGVADERDRTMIANALRAHRLLETPQENQTVRVIRGIASLCRMPSSGMRWAEGGDMRLAFLFLFGEHLTPGGMANGTQTDPQLVATELAHLTAQSLALRSSGNLLLFHGREGMLDELVCGALHPIRLALAAREEKTRFLAAAQRIYDKAQLEPGLDAEGVASLTANTTNRGLEGLLRASHRTGRVLTARELTRQKSLDVEQLSEHTLTVLDTSRVADLQLVGRNIAVAAQVLSQCAQALLRGDPSTPGNLLLCGAPGTGKTDLAIDTAQRAKASAYQLHSPKGGIVGETERKARIQQTVAKEWSPNVCFADEISEMLPLQRRDYDGDSGASSAVMAAMLTSLSDESRRGRSLLIASTNCPWRIGSAMLERFTVIPVLQPLAEDYPGILVATARRVDPRCGAQAGDAAVQDAARLFYAKGANARHIRAALSDTLLLAGTLTPESLLEAARDFTGSSGFASAVYADLWAIKCCRSTKFLPWGADPSSYKFPEYLSGLVNSDGTPNQSELEKRIEHYRDLANV